jgi:hypothetical protein
LAKNPSAKKLSIIRRAAKGRRGNFAKSTPEPARFGD